MTVENQLLVIAQTDDVGSYVMINLLCDVKQTRMREDSIFFLP
jgi:hypothetical protein